jgi:hypothetical protein
MHLKTPDDGEQLHVYFLNKLKLVSKLKTYIALYRRIYENPLPQRVSMIVC